MTELGLWQLRNSDRLHESLPVKFPRTDAELIRARVELARPLAGAQLALSNTHSLDEVRQHLARGADVDGSQPNISTPLYEAIVRKADSVALFLIEHKADVCKPTQRANSALSLALAVEDSSVELVRAILYTHGLPPPPPRWSRHALDRPWLHAAVATKRVELVRLLLEMRPSLVSDRDDEGRTAKDLAFTLDHDCYWLLHEHDLLTADAKQREQSAQQNLSTSQTAIASSASASASAGAPRFEPEQELELPQLVTMQEMQQILRRECFDRVCGHLEHGYPKPSLTLFSQLYEYAARAVNESSS